MSLAAGWTVQDDDLPEDNTEDWEENLYKNYAKKDFVRSIYI